MSTGWENLVISEYDLSVGSTLLSLNARCSMKQVKDSQEMLKKICEKTVERDEKPPSKITTTSIHVLFLGREFGNLHAVSLG